MIRIMRIRILILVRLYITKILFLIKKSFRNTGIRVYLLNIINFLALGSRSARIRIQESQINADLCVQILPTKIRYRFRNKKAFLYVRFSHTIFPY
jgi:hypothetical protein